MESCAPSRPRTTRSPRPSSGDARALRGSRAGDRWRLVVAWRHRRRAARRAGLRDPGGRAASPSTSACRCAAPRRSRAATWSAAPSWRWPTRRAGRASSRCGPSTWTTPAGAGAGARWSPAAAAANARRATEDSTAIAYLGDFDSGATRVSLPITNEARMLQVSPASAAIDLVQPFLGAGDQVPEEVQPTGERTFGRVIPSDEVQAEAAAGWAKRLGARRVGTRLGRLRVRRRRWSTAFRQAAGRPQARTRPPRLTSSTTAAGRRAPAGHADPRARAAR